jgi:hypothetical protein
MNTHGTPSATKPDHCLACQGRDLYQADAAGSEGIVLRPSRIFSIGPFRAVVARYSICLTCGFVAPYISEADRASIRGWQEKEKQKRDAMGTVGER